MNRLLRKCSIQRTPARGLGREVSHRRKSGFTPSGASERVLAPWMCGHTHGRSGVRLRRHRDERAPGRRLRADRGRRRARRRRGAARALRVARARGAAAVARHRALHRHHPGDGRRRAAAGRGAAAAGRAAARGGCWSRTTPRSTGACWRRRSSARASTGPTRRSLCTVALARRFAPLARQRKLAPLAESLGHRGGGRAPRAGRTPRPARACSARCSRSCAPRAGTLGGRARL